MIGGRGSRAAAGPPAEVCGYYWHFVDVIWLAMFATIYAVLGADAAGSVTLDLHNQFIGAGRSGQPLDVVSEVTKETGRLVFVRGTVEQGDHLVSSFVGILRKPSRR
jgi:acyl-coenzyme A thioesterase PaaI-like protein